MLSVLLLDASVAQACKCRELTPAEGYADAGSVFEGRVLSISPPADETHDVQVALAVVRAWKGMEVERVTVVTSASSASCGFTFAPDTSYLVYAHEREGRLSVSLCSRTRPIAQADEDLRVFGMGQTPVDPKADPLPAEPEPEPPAQGGCASCAVLGAQRAASVHAPPLSLLALAGLLGLLRRRATSRRRSRSRS